MKTGTRKAIYDRVLRVEAYCFDGVAEMFPNHVHEFYVFGLVERGERRLTCAGSEYVITAGDVLIFNPGDSHACTQSEGTLAYRALNVPVDVMLGLTGRAAHFAPNVLRGSGLGPQLRELHDAVFGALPGRDTLFREFLCGLDASHGGAVGNSPRRAEVERAREYIAGRYPEHITLGILAGHAGLSKSALLRAFKKELGVTPCRYLESVRVGEARRLLELGFSPAEAAALCGFADQSHLTNCFGRLTGLTPGIYREIFCKDGDTDG